MYKRIWQDYKKLKQQVNTSTSLIAIIGFSAVFLMTRINNDSLIIIAFFIVLLALIIPFRITYKNTKKIKYFRCPLCNNFFSIFELGFMPVCTLTDKCVHCGLPKWANGPGPIINLPEKIDDADILYYTENDIKNKYNLGEPNENKLKDITCLAVCRYPELSDDIYLFSCNMVWKIVEDSKFASVEEAMSFAKNKYKKNHINWIKK